MLEWACWLGNVTYGWFECLVLVVELRYRTISYVCNGWEVGPKNSTETRVRTVQQFIGHTKLQKPPGREFRKPGDGQGASRQRSLGWKADQVTVAGTTRKGQGQALPGRESRKPGDRQGASSQRSKGRKADQVTVAGMTRKGQGQAGLEPGSNPTMNAQKFSMLQKTIWQRVERVGINQVREHR